MEDDVDHPHSALTPPADPTDTRDARRGRRPLSLPSRTLILGGLLLVAIATLARVATPAEEAAPAPAVQWIRHPARPFSIAATEATVAQFRACVAAGSCHADTTSSLCNFGRSDRDGHPVNCITYQGAEQYCAHVGGRVCTEEEWLDACRGTDGRAFPYGSTFDLAICNTQSLTVTVDGRERGTAPVASLAGCQGGLPGLFDMAGNVAEWVNSCNGNYCKFRGAGYLSNDPVDSFAGCSGVCSGNDRSFQSGVVGIRCCRDETS
jgi:formylglycine-generating enzyme required for sulfatase activity